MDSLVRTIIPWIPFTSTGNVVLENDTQLYSEPKFGLVRYGQSQNCDSLIRTFTHGMSSKEIHSLLHLRPRKLAVPHYPHYLTSCYSSTTLSAASASFCLAPHRLYNHIVPHYFCQSSASEIEYWLILLTRKFSLCEFARANALSQFRWGTNRIAARNRRKRG